MKNLVGMLVWLVVMAGLLVNGAEIRYFVTELPRIGDNYWAVEINDRGEVVGTDQSHGMVSRGFIYSSHNGSIRDLGIFSENNGSVTDINSSGQVVGFGTDRLGNSYAVMYSEGSWVNIPISGQYSIAFGINDSGQVVGVYGSAGILRSYLFSGNTSVDLGTLDGSSIQAESINNLGQVVGKIIAANRVNQAFIYDNGKIRRLLVGGTSSVALDINSSGQIVGEAERSNEGYEPYAFLYSNGSVKDLGTLGGTQSRAFSINDDGIVVGSTTKKNDQQVAFVYMDGVMRDLNDLISSNYGLKLFSAISINNRGQILCFDLEDPQNVRWFILTPVAEGMVDLISKQPVAPTSPTFPEKEEGKDSLIVVTHGLIPPGDSPEESTAWVDEMTNAIAQYFSANHINNWQVVGYKWPEKASIQNVRSIQDLFLKINNAFNEAAQTGLIIGNIAKRGQYKSIHLLGHSAGANLIDAFSRRVFGSGSDINIQCTFLDPFVGLDYFGQNSFGRAASWSDCYLSTDIKTGGKYHPFTASPLKHAYNVDVSDLQRDRDYTAYVYTGTGINEPCMRPVSPTHDWPIQFYLNTITGQADWEYESLGFPLSYEGGNWGGNDPDLKVNNDPIRVLGTKALPCTEYLSPGGGGYDQMLIDAGGTPSVDLGQVFKSAGVLELQTHSPAWTLMSINVTNKVNALSFEARFKSQTGSRGLLTVYWNTNVLGTIDELAVQSETRTYTFGFPMVSSNSLNSLGFRLDPFTSVQSSIVISNIVLSAVGVTEPFSLSVTTNKIGELPIFRFTGQPGFNYTVEASTNLVDWQTMAILVNTNGVVDFTDYGLTNHNSRFYRAVVPL